MRPLPDLPSWAHLPVEEFLLRQGSQRNLSPHSLAAYRRDLSQFMAFCDRAGVGRIHGRRPPPGTEVRRVPRHARLRAAVDLQEDLSRTGLLLPTRPGVGRSFSTRPIRSLVPVGRRPFRTPFRSAWFEMLLDSLQGSEPLELRDRAILEFLYATGVRVAELAALRIGEVRDQEFVRSPGKGNRQRTVPLGKTCPGCSRPIPGVWPTGAGRTGGRRSSSGWGRGAVR